MNENPDPTQFIKDFIAGLVFCVGVIASFYFIHAMGW